MTDRVVASRAMVDEPDDLAAQVARAVDADEVLEFARALIAAPSENPGGTEDAAAEVATQILDSLGAKPTTIRSEGGRPSVIASLGSGSRPKLAWNGHLDVVPAGSPQTWNHGPWAGEIDDGRLVGRGSVDMKGGIAAALAAAAAIVRTSTQLAGTLDFHLVADEELAGNHGTKVLRDKGLLDQDLCIVGEPTELQLALAERGGAWVTVTARGRAAHGSQPHRGVNAITTMSRFLLRLPEVLPDIQHPLVGRPTVNASLISGGSAPNVVPDLCEADIDRRVIPGETDPDVVLEPFKELAARLRAEHPESDIEVKVREWTDAAEATDGGGLVATAEQAVLEETGTRPSQEGFSGITDGRFYINDAKIPTVILGPGSMTVAHTANESVAVEELVAAARIYARIFVRLLAPALP
jgi:acetylornithine deacetylase/succinyl-diaminopimelate desuccinylase family protein